MSDTTSHTTDWPLGKLIGFGQSWSTYEDPRDVTKVIKISAIPEDSVSTFTRSEVLRNLMHLIIPANVPQIFEVGVRSDGTRQLRVEKILFHEQYARLIYLKNTGTLSEAERTELHDAFESHAKWVETDEKCSKLFSTFEDFGIATIKGTHVNVVRTPDDVPVYIDDMLLDLTIDQFQEKATAAVEPSKQELLKTLVQNYSDLSQDALTV